MIIARARGGGPFFTLLLLSWWAFAAPAEAQQEVETDSISGDLVEMRGDTLIVRTTEGQEMTFQIPSDTAQERREEVEDTVAATEVAHSSYMSRDDIVLALEQVQESEETDAVHLHYITEGFPARHVVVWLSVGQP